MTSFLEGARLQVSAWSQNRRLGALLASVLASSLALLPFEPLTLSLAPWSNRPALVLPYTAFVAWAQALAVTVALIPRTPQWETRRARVRVAQLMTWLGCLAPTLLLPFATYHARSSSVGGAASAITSHLLVSGLLGIGVTLLGGVLGGALVGVGIPTLFLVEQAAGVRTPLADLQASPTWAMSVLTLAAGSAVVAWGVGCTHVARRLDRRLLG